MRETEHARGGLWHNFIWLGVFAISMGVLEAIVVVYLRDLYHPAGFQFPLTPVPQKTLFLEMLREICTITMLVAVSAAVGKITTLRLSYFLFTFGVWDIVYYIGLKVFLDWPQFIFTWDVLFLIPVAWTGPVLAPLIVSFTMIGASLLFAYIYGRFGTVRTVFQTWALMALGAFLIFLTFIWDYSKIIIGGGFLPNIANLLENPAFQAEISRYAPVHYNWPLFALGETMIVTAAILVYNKNKGD